MVSISKLFTDFMELVGIHYYDKSETDTKFALKSEIPPSSTIDSSLSSTSENPVQNKVIQSALAGKSDTNHTHNQYLTSHQDISGKLDKAQGSSNASKNVVTDTNGNITTEAKPTIPTKVSDLTNDSNYVTTSDSRLSDARTPTSHTHGDITNDGKIGSTANKPIITTTNGKLTTGSFGTSANTFCQGNDSRLSDARTPTSHTHGSLTNDGKIGSASGKIITTGTNGALQASDSITKSMISDFPSSMAPSSHEHNATEVKDSSAYTNIGSSANATQHTINDKVNTALGNKANSSNVYSKSETYTQSEIITLISNAVSDLDLFEVVTSLPTTNIKDNRLYLIANSENITNDAYDVYLRVNNAWERLDDFSLGITNYYKKTEVDTLLEGKVDTTDSRLSDTRTPKSHTHGNITNAGAIGSTANKPIITTTSGKLTTGSFGTTANTFCQGNDSRLSDARTPTSHTHTKSEITDFPTTMTPSSHTHTKSEITDFPTTMTPSSHTHGNLQNDGIIKVSSTVQKSKNLVTDSNGYITAEDKYSHPSSHPASMITGLSTVATTGSYNDLSNKPTIPAAYTHPTEKQCSYSYTHPTTKQCNATIPDVSGKIDTAGTGLSKSGTTLNHSNSITAQTSTAFKKFKYDAQGHITGVANVTASDLPTHSHSQPSIDELQTSIMGITPIVDNGPDDIELFDRIKYSYEDGSISYISDSDGDIAFDDFVTTSDSRLSDNRTPSDNSVTNTKVASNAAIAFSKLNISKSDITGLGIPGSDTTYSNATTTSAGLMSSDDKTKLNGIATGANAYSHPSSQQCSHNHDSSYVAKSQGTTNSGKFLKVNGSGNVTCESVTIPSAYTHPSTKQCDYAYTHPTTKQCNASIPTDTSDLTNGAGFLTSHQDISGKSDTTHTHGNITSDGKVGSSADYFVYTTTSGKVTSKQKIGNITTAGAIGSTASKPIITTTSGVLTTGSFGTTSGTFCQGNDSRLHSHTFTYSGGTLTIS